jgi:hypothetical protein
VIILPDFSVALLETPEVKEVLIATSAEFDVFNTDDLYERYLAVCGAVDEWKFSPDGELDSFLSYNNERNGYNPPRIVKRKYKDINEARFLGKYCCGYISGEHVVTVFPTERGLDAITASLYQKKPDGSVKVIHFRFRFMSSDDNRIAELISLSNIIILSDSLKLKAGVGNNNGAFTIYLYEFSGQKPISVKIFSKGWPSEENYAFHYDDNGFMYKVTYGKNRESCGYVVWEKK